MDRDSIISYCTEQVRIHDRDRYICALFFPEAVRAKLFILYAFNLEIAGIAESVSEPMLGFIRLTWWREALDEIYEARAVRQHPVAQGLATLVAEHGLERAWFDRLLSARERDMEWGSFATLEALETYARETSASLLMLAAQCLNEKNPQTHSMLTMLGTAWALTGLLRAHKPVVLEDAKDKTDVFERIVQRAMALLKSAQPCEKGVNAALKPFAVSKYYCMKMAEKLRKSGGKRIPKMGIIDYIQLLVCSLKVR